MLIYLNYPVSIPFYFYHQGKLVTSSVFNGYVDIYQLYPQVLKAQSLSLVYENTVYNTYILENYTFNSSNFSQGTYLLKAYLNYENGIVLISQRVVNLKLISSDISLLDIFEISKFIYSEDIEDVDIDKLIFIFEIVQDFVESILGMKLIPSNYLEIIDSKKIVYNNGIFKLEKYPIVIVNNINILDTNEELEFEIIDKDSGFLRIKPEFLNKIIGKSISVNYVYGYYPIPSGLLNAIYKLTGLFYDRSKYWNFDRINTLGISNALNKDILEEFEKIILKYKKII